MEDIIKERAAAEHGGEFCDELEVAIGREDVDGFIICAENTRHLPLLEAAIPTGKPVFCEKPFTTSAADARRALQLVREHGTIVHMGYFQPFTDVMQAPWERSPMLVFATPIMLRMGDGLIRKTWPGSTTLIFQAGAPLWTWAHTLCT